MFKKRKLLKKLSAIGTHVESTYSCYLNNDEAKYFPSQDDVFSYIKAYRENNVIFKLQIFRIETYSL